MSDTGVVRLLLFRVGGVVGAAEAERVREIVPWFEPTRIPGAPPVVAGVVNVRVPSSPWWKGGGRCGNPSPPPTAGGGVPGLPCSSRSAGGRRSSASRSTKWWTWCRWVGRDRKSTRLNSSHSQISYAVFCLKKKKKIHETNYTIDIANK